MLNCELLCFCLALPDNPSQVSRVVVAVETLDLNDNAPELDRQYTTAMCDSSSIGQVSMCLSVFFDVRVFVCSTSSAPKLQFKAPMHRKKKKNDFNSIF